MHTNEQHYFKILNDIIKFNNQSSDTDVMYYSQDKNSPSETNEAEVTPNRLASGRFQEVRFDVEVPDDATEEEIRAIAKDYLYNHFTELIDFSHIQTKLHPEGVLTHDTIFVGQVVRCVDLGRIGVVIRHKKQQNRRVPVLFSNGEVRNFEPYNLQPSHAAAHSLRFSSQPYVPGLELVEGVIYDMYGLGRLDDMAVLTFNKHSGKAIRVRINYLTCGTKRNVKFMDYDKLIYHLDTFYYEKKQAY